MSSYIFLFKFNQIQLTPSFVHQRISTFNLCQKKTKIDYYPIKALSACLGLDRLDSMHCAPQQTKAQWLVSPWGQQLKVCS